MKKVLSNSKFLVVILFTMLTVAVTAQPLKSESPAELKYVGTVNNHPRLQLNLNNVESDEFIVTITDQTGATIYQDNISGKNVVRTYQLDTDDLDASVVNFHVYSRKSNSSVVYKVNNNQRFVQDVVINKK